MWRRRPRRRSLLPAQDSQKAQSSSVSPTRPPSQLQSVWPTLARSRRRSPLFSRRVPRDREARRRATLFNPVVGVSGFRFHSVRGFRTPHQLRLRMTRRTTAFMWCRGQTAVRMRTGQVLLLALLLVDSTLVLAQPPPSARRPTETTATDQLPMEIPADVPLPPPPPRRPIGQVKVGAWTLTPSVLLTNIGVDTNVYNSNGQPKSAFTATFGPVLDAAYNSRVLTFNATVTAGYIYYSTFSNQGGFSPSLLLAANYRLSRRVDLFSNNFMTSTKSRPSIEIDTRSRRVTTDNGIRIGFALSRKLRLEVEQRYNRNQYDENALYRGIALAGPLNERTTTFSGTLKYKLTPYTEVRMVMLTDNVEYPLAFVRDGRGTEYAGGVEFNPRALLSGDLQIGYRRFRSRSPLQPDYNGPVYDGRIMFTPGESTGVMFGLHKGMMPSYSPLTPYYVLSQYEGNLLQRLSRRFDTGLNVTYYDMGYRALTVLPVDPQPFGSNAERSFTASIGFLTRRIGRYAFYMQGWQRRYLAQQDRNYDALRFGFMITSTRWLTATSGFGRGVFVSVPPL